MTPERMFGKLLGLGLKWRVRECAFHKDKGRVELEIEHTDEVWQLERCPRCGSEAKGCDRTEPLRWRHLNVMQHRREIVARLPRGRCLKRGHTWRVRPPWEGAAGGFSQEFEAFALLLLREMASNAPPRRWAQPRRAWGCSCTSMWTRPVPRRIFPTGAAWGWTR